MQPAPSARTRYLGVLGWPVAHSYSPAMQEAAFAALGLDLRYGGFAVCPEDVGAAIAGAGALGFLGLNVTVPHKEAALAYCRPDATARAIGAVNTLVYEAERGVPRGVNTDAHGLRMLLIEAGLPRRGRHAVVLGAGGAARAVVHALLEDGARVTVVSRSARRVVLGGAPFATSETNSVAAGAEIPHVPWTEDALGRLLPETDLLVDTTTRGLDASARFDVGPLPAHAAVVDIAVRRATALVTAARARGLVGYTGEAMLLHQGAAAFEAWCGRPAPVEVMRAALQGAMAANDHKS